jgi:hypothetical protein
MNLRAIKSRAVCSSVLVFLVGIFLAGACRDFFSAAEASGPQRVRRRSSRSRAVIGSGRNRYVRIVGVGAQRFCCLGVYGHSHGSDGVNLPGVTASAPEFESATSPMAIVG